MLTGTRHPRRAQIDLQPLAFPYMGIRQIRQMEYLVVAIEYFTKWIEVEPVA